MTTAKPTNPTRMDQEEVESERKPVSKRGNSSPWRAGQKGEWAPVHSRLFRTVKVQESMEKFVLGAAYDGLKFGYLWSLGTGPSGDARGFRQIQLDAVHG